jgi:hypothetical protein
MTPFMGVGLLPRVPEWDDHANTWDIKILKNRTMGEIAASPMGGAQVPGNEPYDWVDDDSMSAEETLRRFEALGAEPTTGPP